MTKMSSSDANGYHEGGFVPVELEEDDSAHDPEDIQLESFPSVSRQQSQMTYTEGRRNRDEKWTMKSFQRFD